MVGAAAYLAMVRGETVLGVGGRVSVVPKLAWVSPAQPRLPSDSKSVHWLKGGEWALLKTTTNPAISRAWCC